MKRLGGIKKPGGVGGQLKVRPPLQTPEIEDPTEGVEWPDDESDEGGKADAALTAAQKGLHDRRQGEEDSMALTTDGAFYCVLVFDTRDQKMAFLRGAGLTRDGDIYIDGRKLADKLGVAVPEVKTKMPKLFRVDKTYGALAMKRGEK